MGIITNVANENLPTVQFCARSSNAIDANGAIQLYYPEETTELRDRVSQDLCGPCSVLGYCRNMKSYLVTDEEIASSDWVFDLRDAASKVNVAPGQWSEHLNNLYRDYPGWIVGTDGLEIFLDMEPIEGDEVRYFFRDFCKAPRQGQRCHVRPESKERVRIVGTILRA